MSNSIINMTEPNKHSVSILLEIGNWNLSQTVPFHIAGKKKNLTLAMRVNNKIMQTVHLPTKM